MAEWDPLANAPLRPDRIKLTYDKAAAWHCADPDHPSYRMSPWTRSKVAFGCHHCGDLTVDQQPSPGGDRVDLMAGEDLRIPGEEALQEVFRVIRSLVEAHETVVSDKEHPVAGVFHLVSKGGTTAESRGYRAFSSA